MKMSKRFKKLFSLVIAGMMVFSLAGCQKQEAAQEPAAKTQAADDSWSKVENNKKLVVGLCAAYPPFESRNEKSGEFEGFDIDLAKALGKELGVEVEIKDAEWQALLGGLNKGDFDVLITCMSKKEAAVENVNMSDVYYELNDVIVVKEGDTSIKSVEDLKGKVVGVQLGSASEQIADKMEGLKEIKRYNYNPEAFIDLQNGRADAVLVGYAYAVNHMKENAGFSIVENAPLETSEIVMVMRHGEDELTGKMNEALAKVKANGEYDNIIAKWLKVD